MKCIKGAKKEGKMQIIMELKKNKSSLQQHSIASWNANINEHTSSILTIP